MNKLTLTGSNKQWWSPPPVANAADKDGVTVIMTASIACSLLFLGVVLVVVWVPLGLAWKKFRPMGRGNNLVK